MGFSLTGVHVVFFISSVIIASAVSGVFIGVITGIMSSFEERGKDIQDQLDMEFKIINDPNNIPIESSNYLFYLKNIGRKKISTTNETFTVFIDGELVVVDNFNFSDSTLQTDDVTILYIDIGEISIGEHKLRAVGPQDIDEEFTFTI